jgi:hypothetical protein
MASKDDKVLQRARKRFAAAKAAWDENRRWYREDIEFALMGKQWPDEAIALRGKDRPMLVINRIPSFARQVVNDARQNKPSIKVRPADSQADPHTADIYNGLIRNIEQSSNAEVAYDTALESAVYGGFGFFRVDVDYSADDTFDKDLHIERIANALTVYPDPRGEAADSSDWRYCFVTELVPREEFEATYGDAADAHDWTADGDAGDDADWYEDDCIRVAEYWERVEVMRPVVLLSTGEVIGRDEYDKQPELWGGAQVVEQREVRSFKVRHYVLTGTAVLEEQEWAGRYIPIIPVWGVEVIDEGKRRFRSMTREVADAQRMYNYWRSAATELVALAPKAPWIGPVGSFDSDPNWKTANTGTHQYLEYDPQPGQPGPQRQPFAGVPAGALQEALSASDDMKAIVGIYDASLGARSNETSGRAILARQREGDVSNFHWIDNLSRAIRHAGRVLIDLIPAVYDRERIVRVLGEDGSPRTVAINGPDPDDPTRPVYELARGTYDLTVDVGPAYTTKRDEAANFILETMRANPATAPLLMDVLARNLDIPEADTVAKRFKAMLPPPIAALEQQQEAGGKPSEEFLAQQLAQAQMQLQQMQQAMQQMQQQQAAEMQKVEIERQKAAAEIQLEREKTAAEIELEREKLRADVALKQAAMTGDMQMKRLSMRSDAALKMRAQKDTAQTKAQASLRNGDSLDAVVANAAEAAAAPVRNETQQVARVLAAAMAKMSEQQVAALQQVVAAANSPKRIVRDPQTGRPVGVEPVPPQESQP